jgi:hypothetical protein
VTQVVYDCRRRNRAIGLGCGPRDAVRSARAPMCETGRARCSFGWARLDSEAPPRHPTVRTTTVGKSTGATT